MTGYSRVQLTTSIVSSKRMRMHRALGCFLSAAVLALASAPARADSELVIAIRYLQDEGTSQSHLYLYREDGKLLRQLTNDNSGQDSAPVFAPNGGPSFSHEESQTTCANFGALSRRAQI